MKAQEIYYGLKIIHDEVNGKIERVIVITRTNLGNKLFVYDISQMSYIDAKRKAEEEAAAKAEQEKREQEEREAEELERKAREAKAVMRMRLNLLDLETEEIDF